MTTDEVRRLVPGQLVRTRYETSNHVYESVARIIGGSEHDGRGADLEHVRTLTCVGRPTTCEHPGGREYYPHGWIFPYEDPENPT
jgi:hypothetical protein